jgi:hypothetical protein
MEATLQQQKQQTADKLAAALSVIRLIADTIREVGSVPSGTLYANLMGRMDLGTYQRIIDTLKGAGLVSESRASLLTWIGPEVTK